MAEEVSHTKDIVIAVLDTIAFLLVIPEVLIRVRPWIQKGTSVAWREFGFLQMKSGWMFYPIGSYSWSLRRLFCSSQRRL